MSSIAPLQTLVAKPQPLSSSAHAGSLLQRKCACGSPTSSLTGECAECKSKKRLQPKLTIGASTDPLEQEADRVADQVMAPPTHSAVSAAPPRIQRYVGQAFDGAAAAPASVDRVLASPGSPLEPALRQDMEHRFGHDFSRVRVQSGAAAEQSARDVNAQAYAVGHNIVFGAGRFAPGTHEGRRLIAHELTHVMQQSGSNGIRVGHADEKCGLSPSIHVVQQNGGGTERAVQRDVDRRSAVREFKADPARSNDVAFGREQGEVDAARVRKRGLTEPLRKSLAAKLKFFTGKALETYKDLLRPALLPNEEIEMPAEMVGIQSYVYIGDPGQKQSEPVARERGRDLGARIRKVGGRPTAEHIQEFEGMGRYFVGEARALYEQEVNESREKRDYAVSRLVRDSIKAIDDDASEKELVSLVAAVMHHDPKRGLRQWAIELKGTGHTGHGRKGNYLLAFIEELGGDDISEEEQPRNEGFGRTMATEVIRQLREQGISYEELVVERALGQMSFDEQSKLLQVDIKRYHIYDWKRAIGAKLEPIVEIVNMVIHFVPVLGNLLGALEGLIGYEILTGRKLETWERFLGILLPYAGKIVRAGKGGVQAIMIIAKELKMPPASIYRLLKGAQATAADADKLREIKRLVDTYQQISPAHRSLLRDTARRFRSVEQEAKAAGVLEKADHLADTTTRAVVSKGDDVATKIPVREAAGNAKAPRGTVLAEKPVSGGHEIQVTPEGIRMCSPRPCDFIRNHYRGELSAQQEARLLLADANRTANPKLAADIAAEVRDELEAARAIKRTKPPKTVVGRTDEDPTGFKGGRKKIPAKQAGKQQEETSSKVVGRKDDQSEDPKGGKGRTDDNKPKPAKPAPAAVPEDPQQGVKDAITRADQRIAARRVEIDNYNTKIATAREKANTLHENLKNTPRGDPGREKAVRDLKQARKKVDELVAQVQGPIAENQVDQAAKIRLQKALDEKTYDRPSWRADMRQRVWDNAMKEGGGKVLSPSNKQLQFEDDWVIGHKPKYEFRKHQESAAKRGISREKFRDEYNRDATHYRPETTKDNSSRKYEDRTDAYRGF